MQRRPKILIVSYWYPPAVGAAAERIQSFARYLPEFGFDVCVLTAEHDGGERADGIRVVRVPDPLGAGVSAFADYDGRKQENSLRSWMRDLVFPDRFLHWSVAAAQRGGELLRDERFDAILASFPPASAVSAALSMHRASGVPLVLDYRDRWLGPGGYDPASPASRRRHQELEREAVKAASGIVAVSERMADAIAVEHRLPRARVGVVMNGYDESRVSVSEPVIHRDPDDKRLLIAHVGTVIERNRPNLFFESIARLHQQGKRKGYRFVFVGNLSRAYVQAAGLSEVIETTGLVGRADADAWMHSADALLLLTGAYVGEWGISAKLFEYLHAGRPVLCLEEVPGSNDRLLLEETAPDRCVFGQLGDDDATLAALSGLSARVVDGPGSVPSPEFQRFSRRRQCEQLAGHLRAILP